MVQKDLNRESDQGLWGRYLRWYKGLPKGHKAIYIAFLIWSIQAIPKWTIAIVGDGETSAAIMKVFITPR
jgi:hypothetical protein